ncbi:MAG: DUF1624 domain-containing protein [Bryobacterales bacterium]|nr:DUF1624 domain-containing protein [Bryobacterales bacterium]
MATTVDPKVAASAPVSAGGGKSAAAVRLYSLDAFRGMTMIWMFSSAFGLHHIKDESVLGVPLAGLERQFTHADWHGMYAWDMIQPFFMFIVGVAMPFSFGNRRGQGAGRGSELLQVLRRCALLLLLGTMARSISAGKPVLDVINVLGQLSVTYLLAYLVLDRGWKVQFGAAIALLALHWGFYNFVTAPEITGPYDKNANPGWWLDGVLLGKHWGGGYATINCISSAANTIFGVMAGFWLKEARPAGETIRKLLLAAVAAVALGLLLSPVIPINKKIWTASFTFVSTGITLATLAGFYWLCDVKQWRGWARPMAIVGMNSIFIYLFHEMLYRWLRAAGQVFTGWAVQWWGNNWGLAFNECVVVAFQIYVCYWLYKHRVFVKV